MESIEQAGRMKRELLLNELTLQIIL